jgi:hypothetical protein
MQNLKKNITIKIAAEQIILIILNQNNFPGG